MNIQRVHRTDLADWLALRTALWPDSVDGEHEHEIRLLLDRPGDTVTFIARDDGGNAIGLAEAGLRHDYVNGCDTSPVAFLEGIYVRPEARRHGVSRALVSAVKTWARKQGCAEMASDAAVDNQTSHQMHLALGFAEAQRVIFFRKVLD